VSEITVAIDSRIVAETKKITLDFQDEGLVIMGMDQCC
jgi:hypothetical protein